MKKFLAIVFTLIFALSACTVAFAADFECGVCHAIFADQKTLDAHNNGGCLEQFGTCQYCAAKVRIKDTEGEKVTNLTDHEGDCPKGAEACDYCGKMQDCQNSLKEHKAEKTCEKKCADCGVEVKMADKDTHECAVDKQLTNLIETTDWEAVINTVVEAVKGIDWDGLLATVEDVFGEVEKLLGDIDFEGIFAEIEAFFGDLAADK